MKSGLRRLKFMNSCFSLCPSAVAVQQVSEFTKLCRLHDAPDLDSHDDGYDHGKSDARRIKKIGKKVSAFKHRQKCV